MNPPHPPAYLVIQNGPYAGRRAAVGGAVYAIGRDPRCHLRPPDEAIAPVHATLHLHQGAYYVRDRGSQSGTFVNGQRVNVARLHAGDTLRVGSLTLQFQVAPPIRSLPQPVAAPQTHPPAQPVPSRRAPARGKDSAHWVGVLYSLTIVLIAVLIVGGMALVIGDLGASASAPPPGFDPATATPATVLYFYADW